MKILTMLRKCNNFIFLFFFISTSFFGQNFQESLFNSHKKFSQAPREVVYVHLNKSSFIEGEMLAYNAYVLNKSNKTLLPETANLYCTIVNDKNKIIKSKLVEVKDGVAHNTFMIDSIFKTGTYKFRAYTNWMLNFSERNYYEHSFAVMNSDSDEKIQSNSIRTTFNVQVLPESGHLVANLKNNLGIVVKNNLGFGLKNANGKLIDNLGNEIINFKLNQFGIAKIPLIPEENKNYQVVVNHNEKVLLKSIKNVDLHGLVLSVKPLRGKIGLLFKTNKSTQKIIKNKKYSLVIHNGNKIKGFNFQFSDKTEFYKILKNENLFTGINIFTVFDLESKKPILERLYFNYDNIQKHVTQITQITKQADSVDVKLNFNKKLDSIDLQNISISVLPSKTKSYAFNSNILSQSYLEPYVRGFIENAAYYFSKHNSEVKYNLDNLLITQGWSSYKWDDIFKEKKYNYEFEQGIIIKANINSKKSESYLVLPLKNNKSQVFIPKKSEKSFSHPNLFPLDNESYKVSLTNKKYSASKPKLFLEYKPSFVPELSILNYEIPLKKTELKGSFIKSDLLYTNFNESETLNEIVLVTNLEKKRREKIKNSSNNSRVDFFDDKMTNQYPTIESYLRTRGFNVSQSNSTGVITIQNQRANNGNNTTPIVILDDNRLIDLEILRFFRMDIVDYVEIDQLGIQYGLGSGGVIKIVTDPVRRASESNTIRNNISTYDFPLTFDSPKKYYTPNYVSYNTKFFKEYGAISWFPNLKINKKGFVEIKIPNNYIGKVNLYIEGVLGSSFVSEIQSIDLD